MKKMCIALVLIMLLLGLFYIALYQRKNIKININVKNNTLNDIDTSIKVSIGKENDSSIQNIYELNHINYNEEDIKQLSIEKIEGDFAIIITVEENSSNSYYFINGTRLSDFNICLNLKNSIEGRIAVEGKITSKQVFSTLKSEKIKSIILKD